jgi:hypothetical protein
VLLMSILNFEEVPVTFAPGASLSLPIVANGRTPMWISTPAGLTGTVLTFVAVGGLGDEVIRDSGGAEITVTLGAVPSRHSLTAEVSAAVANHGQIRVRVGTLAAPVAQAGGATLTMGLRATR